MSSKQARPSRTPFSLAELTASEPLSMDQVNARYPGEWVLLLVTALDEHHEASHGHVLCHSSLRREISRIVRRTHAADSDALLYIFVAGPRIRSGEDARKLLAQIADKSDDKNAWW